jgi:hypothetical protein
MAKSLAENAVHDPTSIAPQVLQFEAVIWGPPGNQIEQLPLFGRKTVEAALQISKIWLT